MHIEINVERDLQQVMEWWFPMELHLAYRQCYEGGLPPKPGTQQVHVEWKK